MARNEGADVSRFVSADDAACTPVWPGLARETVPSNALRRVWAVWLAIL